MAGHVDSRSWLHISEACLYFIGFDRVVCVRSRLVCLRSIEVTEQHQRRRPIVYSALNVEMVLKVDLATCEQGSRIRLTPPHDVRTQVCDSLSALGGAS